MRGFSLVELTLSLGLLALLGVSLVGLVETSLDAQAVGDDRSELHAQGILALERMVTSVQRSTTVHFPNAHDPDRTMLAVSGAINNDSDAYFDDGAYPRIDDDFWSDMTLDTQPGIAGYDDDGDGLVDEAPGALCDHYEDDDEDGACNEDPWDGVDNDKDGNIDEDVSYDMNGDGKPGIIHYDDDGDGLIDEETVSPSVSDDDEDGQTAEDRLNPVIWELDKPAAVLKEVVPQSGASGVLCRNVSDFVATYAPPTATRGPLITIALTLVSDDGETVTLVETVYPRNVLQRWGRRLR